ncbi:MAG: hypothetical protein JST09_04295 [Bacteroidetes bacterium]|nr:hypothetical protein [Bacteroidota bacterium]
MKEEIKSIHASADDIDLLQLIERIIIFFKKYGWTFFVACILGILSGFYVYRSLPKTYSSRLIVHSSLLTNQEEIQIIEAWNQLLKKKDYKRLSTLFSCSKDIFQTLLQIKADEIQKVFSPTNPNGFIIDVELAEGASLDELQLALLNGLENNGYVKQKTELKKANLLESIAKLKPQIARLDSVRTSLEEMILKGKTTSSPVIVDIAGIYKQLIEMNEKMTIYNDTLRFSNAVQLIQGFDALKKTVGPKLTVWLSLGLVFFLSVAYVYALIHSINEKLQAQTRKGKRKVYQNAL